MRHRLTLLLTALLSLWGMSAIAQPVRTDVPSADGTSSPEETIVLRNCHPHALTSEALKHQVRRKRAMAQSEDNPFIGDRHQLVVLVSFSDQDFADSAPEELWNKIFNESGYNENNLYGSVRDYFLEQSYGQLDITFDIQYVALSESRVKYRSTTIDDENSQYLVSDILDELGSRPIDWSQYDWDADSYVDQLLILYAGKGQNAGGDRNTIWPHQWWLSEHIDPNTHQKLSARQVTFDGKNYYVDCYCAIQELTSNSDYGIFGTICHEFTHCFGFPDFYMGSTSYVYNWDLMDYGNYNGSGFCPPGYSAHERMLMGWLSPIELTDPVSVSYMPALCDEPVAYLIRNDSHADEFYMVENRQQRGWDQSLPSNGIVIFHIDYVADMWGITGGYPNSYAGTHYTIIAANNRSYFSSQGWPYPYNDNDSLTNTSIPAAVINNANADGTKLMSKPLYDMKVESGLASFRFLDSESDAIAAIHGEQSGIVKELYRMGRIHIVRCADGTVKKMVW